MNYNYSLRVLRLVTMLPLGRAELSARNNPQDRMSALGQKQTSRPKISMSALPPKADIGSTCQDVRFVPKPEAAG